MELKKDNLDDELGSEKSSYFHRFSTPSPAAKERSEEAKRVLNVKQLDLEFVLEKDGFILDSS